MFTIQTPKHTSAMASRQRGTLRIFPSPSKTAESTTPKTGFKKAKTVMRETGCRCSSSDQIV